MFVFPFVNFDLNKKKFLNWDELKDSKSGLTIWSTKTIKLQNEHKIIWNLYSAIELYERVAADIAAKGAEIAALQAQQAAQQAHNQHNNQQSGYNYGASSNRFEQQRPAPQTPQQNYLPPHQQAQGGYKY